VPLTRAGDPPRASTQFRIVSWSTVVFPSAMNRLLKFRLNEQLLFLLNQRLQRRFQQTRRENDSTS
jgi:hypothetical protein